MWYNDTHLNIFYGFVRKIKFNKKELFCWFLKCTLWLEVNHKIEREGKITLHTNSLYVLSKAYFFLKKLSAFILIEYWEIVDLMIWC